MAAIGTDLTDVVAATRIVEATADALVRRAAQTLVDSFDGGHATIHPSQLSNLVNVAISASSVYEVRVFVMYQIGRSRPHADWNARSGQDKCTFGQAVLRELSHREPETAVAQLRHAAKEAQCAHMRDLVVLLGVRKYAGYLRQLHRFLHELTDQLGEEAWQYVRDLAEQASR
jgi:hypothetical protein